MRRIQTTETKEKIRKSLTKYFPPFEKECPSCHKILRYNSHRHLLRSIRKNQICKHCKVENEISINHFSLMGKKSVESQSTIRRSKNEKYFSELCEGYFQNLEMNKPIFNGWDSDVILHDYKLAILWNGRWHYEKITKKHSVLQVQNRDKLKIKEIIKCGYHPYTIKDVGGFNKNFVEKEFEKLKNYLTS